MKDWIITTCIVSVGTSLMLSVLTRHGFDFGERVLFGLGVLIVSSGPNWRKWP